MPLRIAFDLDGVFADMEGELTRQAEALFGSQRSPVGSEASPVAVAGQQSAGGSPKSTAGGQKRPASPAEESRSDEPPLTRLPLTARQLRRLWDHVETIDNFWETLGELEPGSVARLAAIASDRRWEVIFLTRRPASAGLPTQVQTQRWLQAKGFALPSVFVVQTSRGRIAASLALDFVVDDTPENCLDVVVDSRARAILIWRNEREQLPAAARRLGIGVVRSVGECLGILAEIDAPLHEKPTMMDRVMRLLGMKETTGI